ncbi:MAG: pseudaminic acid biosynthesis-associated methylase [Candidatus Thorarchaeota archaeon]|jgi:pseudaminic acid biosynthesis-associated methylase
MVKTKQEEFWEGEFGDEYTLRNAGDWDEFYKKQWGTTRTELNEEFLSNMEKDVSILEVGCNRANQLLILQEQGFGNLWGIEINKSALQIARENKNFNLVEGSGFDIPFKDTFFDLVFTSGVLIHIAPKNLPRIIDEIYRVSNRYIWGFEYFAEECEAIEYRGHKNRLWKNNFLRLYQERHPDLKVVRQRKIKYLENENVDMMYLLERSEK